jgi:DNA primase
MEPYKDPDEFIKALGPEEFQKRIDEAENSFLFEVSMLEREYDMKDPEGKTGFYNAVAARLMEFETELERENYIEAVAEKYHIGFDNLRKLVNRAAMKGVTTKIKEPRRESRRTSKEDGLKKSQKLLLTWLIEYPKLYEQIKDQISAEDFTEGICQDTAGLLFAQLEQGEVVPAKIIDHFRNPEEQREAAELFNTSLNLESRSEIEKAWMETIYRVRSNGIARRRASLEPTDIAGLQKSILEERELEELRKRNLYV